MSRRERKGGGLIPFPNSAWATEASVPLGMPVLTRAYAHFNGSNYSTINKAQTIGSEYKCFFEGTILAEAPTTSEIIYTMDTAGADLGLYLNSNGADVSMRINGMGGAINVGSYLVGVATDIKLEFNLTGWRVTTDDEVFTGVATWTDTTWSAFKLGIRATGGLNYTGQMWNVSDHNESWPLNGNLKGSLGNDAVLTGSTEAELFDNETGWTVKKSRYVARFNGSNYLTINKAQTIGSEYGVFYESPIIPTAPQGTELVYSPILPSGLFFFFLDGTEVFCNGNGIPATSVGNYNQGVKNTLKLELKLGMIRATVNGVPTEIPITFIETSWASFRVGASHLGAFDLTGQIWDLKADGDDGLESWPLNNTLTGSLGNDAVLTGSTEAVLFGDSLLVPV